MTNKLMISYFGIDFLFALTGGLLIAFSLVSEKDERGSPTIRHIANNILLSHVPLSAGIANAVIIFVTFVLSLPVFFIPSSRFWLHVHAYMTVVCGLFSLVLGLFIWFSTLRTRSRLLGIWTAESQLTQSLLQQRFNCCGYINSTTPAFVPDTTCTNSLVAAQKGGCIGPFSSFANMYLDQIFTALFGIVAVDFLVIIWVAMVMKYRKEQERYRHIDEKNGMSGF